ncbi:MAG: metallophosphoesterase family protein [Bacteroidota bacterium]
MNDKCLFVSDLHGKIKRYEKFFKVIEKEKPFAVFMGGDLLPSSVLHRFRAGENKCDFVRDFLVSNFANLKKQMDEHYPAVFIIMGNDDPRIAEEIFLEYNQEGLWNYIQGKVVDLGPYKVLGYSYVPPTPFLLKDWEKYDMVRDEVKQGSINPSDGFKTFNVEHENLSDTIREDLNTLTQSYDDMDNMICLFHSPPYKTLLDRAALDDVKTTQGNIDVNVGSIAIKNFIQERQPYLCLHGHIHESSRITGKWRDKINRTRLISAAYEGTELAVISFYLSDLDSAERFVI